MWVVYESSDNERLAPHNQEEGSSSTSSTAMSAIGAGRRNLILTHVSCLYPDLCESTLPGPSHVLVVSVSSDGKRLTLHDQE